MSLYCFNGNTNRDDSSLLRAHVNVNLLTGPLVKQDHLYIVVSVKMKCFHTPKIDTFLPAGFLKLFSNRKEEKIL